MNFGRNLLVKLPKKEGSHESLIAHGYAKPKSDATIKCRHPLNCIFLTTSDWF